MYLEYHMHTSVYEIYCALFSLLEYKDLAISSVKYSRKYVVCNDTLF